MGFQRQDPTRRATELAVALDYTANGKPVSAQQEILVVADKVWYRMAQHAELCLSLASDLTAEGRPRYSNPDAYISLPMQINAYYVVAKDEHEPDALVLAVCSLFTLVHGSPAYDKHVVWSPYYQNDHLQIIVEMGELLTVLEHMHRHIHPADTISTDLWSLMQERGYDQVVSKYPTQSSETWPIH